MAVTILVSGFGCAVSIWLAQDRIDRQLKAEGTDIAGPLSPEDSRRYTHEVEMYYGETGLLLDKWKRWWEEMTHGKPLAKIIAGTSLVAAGGVFYVASKRGTPNSLPEPVTAPRVLDQ
ncbi:MAG: hypothetical protein NT154_19915 [Verrucomicrobia bacterium]|nr:hypothetical protein [Verrucomicrobiota bacterium]